MNYRQSLRYLNSFLNLERVLYHPQNRCWNLERMRYLIEWFDHPEKKFFPILIAGTKGKGSTGFFLESLLTEAGFRTGFYCSPHLESPRERIRIHGKLITPAVWVKCFEHVRHILGKKRLPRDKGDFTYFEIMTLVAMLAFVRQRVEVGIFEVGMGGRFDATNILDARVVIFTPIHYDHEAFLGHTFARIAREKAAIIRRGADVVIGPQPAMAMRVIQRAIRRRKAHGWPARILRFDRLGLLGEHQQVNASMAVETAHLLCRSYGWPIDEEAIRRGLAKHNWPGRLEKLADHPAVWIDGAHNPASVEALVRSLRQSFTQQNACVIFAVSRDKRSDRMLSTLSRFFSSCILTRFSNPRSQEIGTLMAQARGLFRTILPTGSLRTAIRWARQLTGRNGLIVITGSFYLIGEARKVIRHG